MVCVNQMSFESDDLNDPVEESDWICPVNRYDYDMRINPASGPADFTYELVRSVLEAIDEFNENWYMNAWIPSYNIKVERKRDAQIRATGYMANNSGWHSRQYLYIVSQGSRTIVDLETRKCVLGVGLGSTFMPRQSDKGQYMYANFPPGQASSDSNATEFSIGSTLEPLRPSI